MSLPDEPIELTPAQPDDVERAVAGLLEERWLAVDPWWQAGLDEALET